MKCGVYTYKAKSGQRLYYKLTEDFARARPWYTFVRDCDCGTNVRMADGERVEAAKPADEPGLRGLGDLVAGAIHIATFGLVSPCAGCEQRREWLNEKVPFGNRGNSGSRPHTPRALEAHGG